MEVHHKLISYLNTTDISGNVLISDQLPSIYDATVHREYERSPELSTATMVTSVCYGLAFVVGVVANLVVITVTATQAGAMSSLRGAVSGSPRGVGCPRSSAVRSVANIYILNLAVADLLFLAWIPIVVLSNLRGGQWLWGYSGCKLYFTGTVLNQFASVGFLTALSVDRYLTICHPVKALSTQRRKIAAVVATACWLIACCLVTPVIMYATTTATVTYAADIEEAIVVFYRQHCAILWPEDHLSFWSRKTFTLYCLVITYLAPLLVIWTLYCRVLKALSKKRKKEVRMRRVPNMKVYRRITSMVFSIVIAYTVFWFPFWLVQLVIEYLQEDILRNYAETVKVASQIAYFLQYANSALNPILYSMMSGAFRQAVQRMSARFVKRGGVGPRFGAGTGIGQAERGPISKWRAFAYESSFSQSTTKTAATAAVMPRLPPLFTSPTPPTTTTIVFCDGEAKLIAETPSALV